MGQFYGNMFCITVVTDQLLQREIYSGIVFIRQVWLGKQHTAIIPRLCFLGFVVRQKTDVCEWLLEESKIFVIQLNISSKR